MHVLAAVAVAALSIPSTQPIDLGTTVITAREADAAQAALAASFEADANDASDPNGGGALEDALAGIDASRTIRLREPPAPTPVDPLDEAACRFGDAPAPIEEMGRGTSTETLTMHDGWGSLVVERKYLNQPRGPGVVQDTIDLPTGQAVVVGAVYTEDESAPRVTHIEDAATAAGLFDSYKRALELGVPAEEAREGDHGAAVLVSVDSAPSAASVVQIGVTAPCSVRIITLRVELRIATLPVDGAWQLDIPRAPSLLVQADFPMRLVVDGQAAHRDVSASMRQLPPNLEGPSPSSEPEVPVLCTVIVKPLAGPKLRARGFATVVTPKALPPEPVENAVVEEPEPAKPVVIARAELDLPKPLSAAPAGLRIVFVVDASVSVGANVLAKEWQVVDGILNEAPPDAQYAVVAAARKPAVVVGPWRDRDDRERAAVELKNGSDIPAALRKAAGIASDLDGESEVARIVVVTDMQLPFAVNDPELVKAFHGVPLTHVVVMADDADVETRMSWQRSFGDDDPRATGPEATGGIWIDTANNVAATDDIGGLALADDGEAALYTHLIRPIRVDRPRVMLGAVDILADRLPPSGEDGGDDELDTSARLVHLSPRDALVSDAGGVEGLGGQLPAYLVEGSGVRAEAALPTLLSKGATPVRDLRVEGFLWATPLVERIAKHDTSLFGLAGVDEIGANLDDDIVRSIGTKAHAVTRVTSLVEVPEWRPEESAASGWGCGCGGCSMCGCGCRGIGTSTCCGGVSVDLHEKELLERLLRDDMRACLVSSAHVTVEFGDLELLDVEGDNACVVERMWTHRIDQLPEGWRDAGAFEGHKTLDAAWPRPASSSMP